MPESSITFFPVENGDTSLLQISDGKALTNLMVDSHLCNNGSYDVQGYLLKVVFCKRKRAHFTNETDPTFEFDTLRLHSKTSPFYKRNQAHPECSSSSRLWLWKLWAVLFPSTFSTASSGIFHALAKPEGLTEQFNNMGVVSEAVQ